MKVSIDFNSSDYDEIKELKGELIGLIHKIDSWLEDTDGEFVCHNKCEDCCEKCDDCDDCCDEVTDEIIFDEEFIDDAREGSRVTEFLNLKLGDDIVFDDAFVRDCIRYGFFTTHSDVDNFVLAFEKLLKREAKRVTKDAIVSKLIDAGFTKEFANHTVEHIDIDIDKIPTKYVECDFIKLLEYLGIKEDFVEKQKQEENDKLMKYLRNEIIELAKVSRYAADTAHCYFSEFKPTSIAEIDKEIANIKKQFKFTDVGPVCTDTVNESDNREDTEDNSYVKFENEERKGYSKRASDHFKKRTSDKKSDKTK